MKKLVVLITLAATAYGYSQSTLGSVSFVTRAAGVNALITYAAQGNPTANAILSGRRVSVSGDPAGYVTDGNYVWGGPHARAMLYAVAGSDTTKALSMITPNVPFKAWTPTTGGFAGAVDATWGGIDPAKYSTTREVPGTEPAGTNPSGGFPQQAVFQIKAWDAGVAVPDSMSYDEAVALITANGKGYYNVGNIFVNSVGGGSAAAAFLVNAQPFALNWVPEPSIIGLGILGAVAGMVVFRRQREQQ